jgi:hypothetical protein
MGVIGEAGDTARSVIGLLGSNPFVLASVVVNLGLVGLLYWSATIAERERSEERKLLYENRQFVGDLLSRCTLTPRAP